MAKKLVYIGRFTFNNDLSEIRFSIHNSIHFFGSLVLAFFSSFWLAYGLGIAWEVLDGFKPWFIEFEYDPNRSEWPNWLRENFLYADGFSLQDAIIWDLGGALAGFVLRWVVLFIVFSLYLT